MVDKAIKPTDFCRKFFRDRGIAGFSFVKKKSAGNGFPTLFSKMIPPVAPLAHVRAPADRAYWQSAQFPAGKVILAGQELARHYARTAHGFIVQRL
jgi:hypothetical protein